MLILFSDGKDTISRSSAREALEQILASGAVLYAVNSNASGDGTYEGRLLTEMSEATGGTALPLHNGDILQIVLAEQRASYVVVDQLPNRAKGLHPLRILPKHDLNLQFHCRRGYSYDEVR